jgi:16S rRNA C1402 (ribose-2'-O) methylase RsmI
VVSDASLPVLRVPLCADRGTVHSAYRAFGAVAERDGKVRGEFTIILAPLSAELVAAQRGAADAQTMAAAAAEVGVRLAAGGAISRVAKEVAAEFGVPKKAVYAEALRQQQEGKRGRRQPG